MPKNKPKLKTSTLSYFLNILFPPICVNCKTRINNQKEMLCENCFNNININNSFYCPICYNRKPSHTNSCHQTPFILAPACFYNEPIPSLVHYYKYKKVIDAQKILSAILITYLKNTEIDLKKFQFSYIPIHPKKQKARGFNQSKKLAQNLSEYFDIPLIDSLSKKDDNLPQANMNSTEKRLKNVANTMKLKSNKINIEGKNIILVDDVSTSGATLYEASKILKKAGTRKIIGLVVAKAQ